MYACSKVILIMHEGFPIPAVNWHVNSPGLCVDVESVFHSKTFNVE